MNPDLFIHGNVVRIRNASRGTVVAERAEIARTVVSRLKGLLGRDALAAGDALILDPCTSIHTFFMRFPIDAAFVAPDGRALRVISAMRPFRATRVYPRARFCLELAAGALEASGTREGDLLSWEAPGGP